MPLPASGQIAFSQLAAELVNACTNIGLRAYSACANCTSPDGITELYGKTCFPIFGAGVWSAAGATSDYGPARGGGTQTAGISSLSRSSYPYNAIRTHLFNGSSWTNPANSIVFRGGGCTLTGNQSDALIAGGINYASYVYTENSTAERWNGSSWATINSMQVLGSELSSAGTSNAALAFGGRYSQGNQNLPKLSNVEQYNGASWSSATNMISVRAFSSGAGTVNAAVALGGNTQGASSGLLSSMELYNGVSWTARTSRPAAFHKSSVGGTANNLVSMGGFGGSVSCNTYTFNGTTWTTQSQPTRGRYDTAGAGAGGNAAFMNAGIGVQGGETGTDLFTQPLLSKCLQ